MKNYQIFTGVKKKCNDLLRYEADGFTQDEVPYIDIVDEQAILIKINDQQYIDFKSIRTAAEKFMVDIGAPINIINVSPSIENPFFVDHVQAYYENTDDTTQTTKTLAKTFHLKI